MQADPPASATTTRYRLVAIDVDGTLLDSTHRIPAANRAALHRAHEAGIRVVLCTGRTFTETRPILYELGLDLDAAVCTFGATVNDARSGATWERVPLRGETAARAAEWLAQRGYSVLWMTDPNEAGHDGFLLRGPRRHPGYDRWLERTPCRVRPVGAVEACDAPALRLSVIDDDAPLRAISDALIAEFGERVVHNVLRAPAYEVTVVELFAPGVNKWTGIQALCRRWGIPESATVAIGDDVNDLAMLAQAGLGVAMGNATSAARAAARRLTAAHDEAGVARVIEALLDEGGAAARPARE
jgi:hypothetical protein